MARSNRSWRSPAVSRPAASASMPLAASRPTRPRNAPRVSRLAGRTTHRRDPSRSGAGGGAAAAPPGPSHVPAERTRRSGPGLSRHDRVPATRRRKRCRRPPVLGCDLATCRRRDGSPSRRQAVQAHATPGGSRPVACQAGGQLHRNVTRAQHRSILPAFPRSLLASKGSTIAGVAQSAERLTRNEQVRGSIPRPGSTRAHQRKRPEVGPDQRKRLSGRPSQWLPSSSPSCRCIPSPVSRACHEIGPSGGSWLWRSASKRDRARSSSPRMTPR